MATTQRAQSAQTTQTAPLITPSVPEDDKAKVESIFNAIGAHLGFIPDGLRLYSISPPLLESFVGAIGYFMGHPKLSQELLAFVRYLVSSDAHCAFCIDFNAGLLMNMGVKPEQLAAAQEDFNQAPLADNEKTLLGIALQAIQNPENVNKEMIDAALQQGFSERDIFDVVTLAANNKALTHVLRTFKVDHQGTFA